MTIFVIPKCNWRGSCGPRTRIISALLPLKTGIGRRHVGPFSAGWILMRTAAFPTRRSVAPALSYSGTVGAAVTSLARQLQREGIPVLLTVQVDSIAKPGQDDRVVPANVARAVNFYQTRGLLHGRSRITAADPARTEILGDFFLDYPETPAECSQYPWLTRHLFRGHTAIECDPRVWSQIEGLIDKYWFAGPAAAVADVEANRSQLSFK
jgi:hypothetical protein